jgi:hypothetical protein
MYLKKIEWDDMDRISLAQDRGKWSNFVNAVMSLSDSIKCCEILEWLRNWWPLE